MQISARNVLKGVVVGVEPGAVNGVVAIALGENVVKANITMDAVVQLGLAEGKEAYAIMKASSVMFAADDASVAGISARNQLHGVVTTVRKGSVNGRVSIELADGNIVTGTVTNEAIDALGLEVGAKALAIVKSTDVMVGVD